MSKLSSSHTNFTQLRAEYSERMRANGDYEGFATVPELFDSLRNQYVAGWKRLEEIKSKNGNLSPQDRAQFQDLKREVGMWADNLMKCGQIAFERAFIVIAQARLPREHFMVISQEARQMWRDAGYADGLPFDRRKATKSSNRMPHLKKELQKSSGKDFHKALVGKE